MKKNTKILLYIILIILVSGIVYLSNKSKVEKDINGLPTNIIFKYGVGAKNILDTFNGTYTKDMISEEPIQINIQLSQDELNGIFKKIAEINLFNKKPVINYSTVQLLDPCSSYYLIAEIDSIKKEISWDDCHGEVDVEFRQFTDYLINTIESNNEYQNLPQSKGGYL